MNTLRLDQELINRCMVKSREEAKRLILAGEVMVGGHVIDKPASKVTAEASIHIKERPKFVSRGGLKLEGALDEFAISAIDRVAIDIGSSTGGFTDCLLQRGASKVYAFDVGTNQLAWKIRNDSRVVVREKFNCRKLTANDLDDSPTIAVADVSFISLTKLLGPLVSVIACGSDIVLLIKPQFELKRDQVGKGGVIKDPALHQQAIDKVTEFATNQLGLELKGCIRSPIKGAAGNVEFLAWFHHNP